MIATRPRIRARRFARKRLSARLSPAAGWASNAWPTAIAIIATHVAVPPATPLPLRARADPGRQRDNAPSGRQSLRLRAHPSRRDRARPERPCNVPGRPEQGSGQLLGITASTAADVHHSETHQPHPGSALTTT